MKKIKYYNAGAGSGKTYTLTRELIEAIRDKGVKPSEVIMTTFTILAAEEIMQRARQALLKAGKVQEAIQLDGACIGTTHSICLRFIQKYWYLLGLSPEFKQLEEQDYKMYLEQSLSSLVTPEDVEWFDEYRKEMNLTHNEDGKFNQEWTDYWYEYLKTIVEKMRYYNVTDLEESKRKSLEAVDEVFKDEQANTSDFNYMRDNMIELLSNITNKKSLEGAQKAISLLQSFDIENLGRKEIKHALSDILSVSTFKTCAKNNNIDIEIFSSAVESVTLTSKFGNPLKECINKIFHYAEIWQKEYEDYKKSHLLLDFNDMELYFLRLLSYDTVREEIKESFKLVMVDEFQDCNPIQLEIFNKLSDIVGEDTMLEYSSIWVGDPKQAIYGFRGSDTELVNEVSKKIEEMPGMLSTSLPDSRRSRRKLVELSNNVFKRAFGDILKEEQIVLNPYRAIEEEQFEKWDALRHWSFDFEKSPTKGYELLGKKLKEFKDSEVMTMTKDEPKALRPIEWKDIAILARNGAEIDNIVKGLKAAGVPVSAPEKDMVARAEIQLVLSVMNFVRNPENMHVRADILHLMKNVPTEELLNDYFRYLQEHEQNAYGWKDDDEMICLLMEKLPVWNLLSVSDLVTSIILELNMMDMVQMWGETDARRRNLGNLQNIAEKYETRCEMMGLGSSINAFMAYFKNGDFELPKDTSSPTVKVMTYHGSKGLEWPVVILSQLNYDEIEDKNMVRKNFMGVKEVRMSAEASENAKYYIRLFPNVGFASQSKVVPIVNAAVETEYYQALKEKTRKEITRLMYVGITRARDYLISFSFNSEFEDAKWLENIGVFNAREDENGELIEVAANDLWNTADKNLTVHTEKIDETMFGDEVCKETETYQLQKNNRPYTGRQKFISPSTAKGTFDVSAISFKTHELEHVHFFSKKEPRSMAQLGTCIHNIFAAFNPDDSADLQLEKAERIIKGFQLEESLPEAYRVINSIKALYKYLTEKYGPAIDIKHECAFALPQEDGTVIRGEMDLLWCTASGVVLVDFKNYQGKLADVTSNDESEHYVGHYFPQIMAYNKALKANGQTVLDSVIYYSMMGGVVTVEC